MSKNTVYMVEDFKRCYIDTFSRLGFNIVFLPTVKDFKFVEKEEMLALVG